MEFSSRKPQKIQSSGGLRHNPYSTGGKTYLSSFQRKAEKANLTPPLKHRLAKYSHSEPKKRFKPRALIRTNNILQNSFQNGMNSKENIDNSKWTSKISGLDKINVLDSPKSSSKRPFKSLNSSLDTSVDPYNVFSDNDSDDDIFLSSKHSKTLNNLDKENNNIPTLNPTTPKSNSVNIFKKKKSVNVLKSNIVHDISPEKVSKSLEADKAVIKSEPEKNVFKFKSFFGKENASSPKELHEVKPVIEHPHMVGFPNFGNTCYLNAVLQTMANLHPFIADLSYLLEDATLSESSLTCSLWNIIVARHKMDWLAIKNSLRTIKENVEKIDGSFSGFKMQDANEFLTQVLDTMKDEVDKAGMAEEEKIRQWTQTPKMSQGKPPILIHPSSLEANEESNSDYEICYPKTPKNVNSIFDTPSSSSPLSLEIELKQKPDICSDDEIEFVSCKQSDSSNTSQTSMPVTSPLLTNSNQNDQSDRFSLINPVTNNFEFELLESYRCLGCSETEGKKQKHLALYVNLPTEDKRSIQEAVESYMSEDQRDLTCDKCTHGKASFITSFFRLPRILIVQMKRYEYKPEQLECIKVSSKVNINMWLHLDNLVTENVTLPHNYLEKPIRFSSKRELKPNTLSVRNLASELNICPNNITEHTTPVKKSGEDSENQVACVSPEEKEEKELQEVILKSMEDVGGEEGQKTESDPSKEEEEFQRAIRLSLQDMGMNYQDILENDTDEIPAEESVLQKGKHSYRLLSIISHFGLTTCTGHYVSDVLNCGEHEWYHYDDESVNSLAESVVTAEGRQKNGYIFFYIHQDIFHNLTKT